MSEEKIQAGVQSLEVGLTVLDALIANRKPMMLKELAEKYPQYMFEKHKGYGTKLHYEMLDKYGASDIHRKSFLVKYFKAKNAGK